MSAKATADPRVSALLARELGPQPRPVLRELLGLQAHPLTAREREITELLLEGRGNDAIATALGVGVKTIKTHVSEIFSKLHVASRGEAVYLLLLLGVLALDPADSDAAVLALRARHEGANDRSEGCC